MTPPRKNISIMVGNQLVTYRVPVPLAEYIADLEGVQNVTKIARNLDEMHFHILEQERDEARAWAIYFRRKCEEQAREIEVLYALRSGRSCGNSPFTSDNE